MHDFAVYGFFFCSRIRKRNRSVCCGCPRSGNDRISNVQRNILSALFCPVDSVIRFCYFKRVRQIIALTIRPTYVVFIIKRNGYGIIACVGLLVAAYRITIVCGDIICLFAAKIYEVSRIGCGFRGSEFCYFKRVSQICDRTVCPADVVGICKRNRYRISTRVGLFVSTYRVTLVFGNRVCLFVAAVYEFCYICDRFFKFDFSYRDRYVNGKFAVIYDNVIVVYGKRPSVRGLISNRVIGYFDITANTFAFNFLPVLSKVSPTV